MSRQNINQATHQALMSAFDIPALRSLVLLHFGDPAEHAIDWTGSRRDVALNVLRWAKGKGRLLQLVEAACEDSPGNPHLQELAERLQREPAPDPNVPIIVEAVERPYRKASHRGGLVRALGLAELPAKPLLLQRFPPSTSLQ